MDKKDEEFLKRLLSTFRIEAPEHLNVIASGLVEIEKGGPEKWDEIIETIYRESHSLKGAARSVNLGDIVAVCQAMESLFFALKRKEVLPSPHMLDLLHESIAVTGRLVGGEQLPASEKPGLRALIRRLEGAAGKSRNGETQKRRNGDIGPAPPSSGPPVEESPLQAGRPGRHAPPNPDTVRIPVARLDALLLKTEELLSVKLAAAERADDLKELKKRFDLWKKGRPKSDPLVGSLDPPLTSLVRAADSDRRTCGAMVDQLLDDMKKTLMLPFSSVLQGFPGLARNLSRDAGKEAELTIGGGDIEIDRRVLEEIKDPLLHLVRNCIDHGIELPEERQRNEKPARGNIAIVVSSRDDKIEIAVSDDGAGIDASRVRSAGKKSGLLSQEEADRLSEHDALLLVFRSGVTTSSIITDISGRGLGLAIVREKVEKLNGTVEIDSSPGAGATIRMIVPLTLATFRGVLVRVDEQVFILPSTNVQRVMRVRKEEIRTVENRESLAFEGEAVSLVRLKDVLGAHPVRLKSPAVDSRSPSSDPYVQVAILGLAEKRMAFLADEILHEQEVLVKPLGRQLSRVRNISGATILGSGKIAPILNVSDLMKSAAKGSPAATRPIVEGPEKKLSILVAEDSITSRTLLKTILESAGYDVRTAVDGLQAFAALESGSFDLVVSDVDMPGMNGFALTAKIRADKRLSELPVVLVTALESREDKERGIDAGANAYIVKSSFDQSTLLEVVKRLI